MADIFTDTLPAMVDDIVKGDGTGTKHDKANMDTARLQKLIANDRFLHQVVPRFRSGCNMYADDTSVTVLPGTWTDDTDERLLNLSSKITKEADTAWSVGNNGGGAPSASPILGFGWLYIYLLANDDGSVVDAGCSLFTGGGDLLANADVVAAGLTRVALIGVIFGGRSGSPSIPAIEKLGDYYSFLVPDPLFLNDFTGELPTTATIFPGGGPDLFPLTIDAVFDLLLTLNAFSSTELMVSGLLSVFGSPPPTADVYNFRFLSSTSARSSEVLLKIPTQSLFQLYHQWSESLITANELKLRCVGYHIPLLGRYF